MTFTFYIAAVRQKPCISKILKLFQEHFNSAPTEYLCSFLLLPFKILNPSFRSFLSLPWYIRLNTPQQTTWNVFIILFFFYFIKHTLLSPKPNSSNTKPEYLSIILDRGDGPVEEQCERLQYDPNQWEFPRERLKLGTLLHFIKITQTTTIKTCRIWCFTTSDFDLCHESWRILRM